MRARARFCCPTATRDEADLSDMTMRARVNLCRPKKGGALHLRQAAFVAALAFLAGRALYVLRREG